MKCVICQSTDIEGRAIDERIWLNDDVVLVPCRALVCNNCGERYYDRYTMQYLEQVENRLRGSGLTLKQIGQVMRLAEDRSPALAVHESPEPYGRSGCEESTNR
jgi:YgiT-type zinc finger domain-containing protein